MEQWLDTYGYYQISNLGNIRNKNTNRILKQSINNKLSRQFYRDCRDFFFGNMLL